MERRKQGVKSFVTKILVCFLICNWSIGIAQDFHFSQFDQTPLLINPAYAGTFGGTHRVIMNYRDQWRAFGAPYKTYALSYDFMLIKEKWDKTKIAGGLFIFRDQAGYSNLSSTQVQLSLSSIISLNENHGLSVGLQGGFAQKAIDLSEVSTDNQFSNGTHNQKDPIGETNNYNSRSYGDFTGGLAWHYVKNEINPFADNQIKATIGFALYHINRPKQEFYDLNKDRLYSKMSIHGYGLIGFKGTQLAMTPSFLILSQGPTKEILAGTMFRYRIREGGLSKKFDQQAAISIGAHYRFGDAIIPGFLLEIANFRLGVSYDINTSKLNVATNGQGGLEISLGFVNPNPFKRKKTSTLL